MKKLILFLFVLFFASCIEKSNKYRVALINNNGLTESHIYCDSLTMVNKNEIIIYNNGKAVRLFAETILVSKY